MKPRYQEPGNQNIIGIRIVELRKEKGMKQKDLLAKLQLANLDISATSLSRLEGQYRHAYDYEVMAVAEALGVDELELLGKKKRENH